jgi:acetylornithine/succinyldiaminopimelate/putrescine aminotransferase
MPSHRQLFFEYLGLPALHPPGIEIVSASGIYLYGPDGQQYIDLVSGVAVSNLGHQHPDIIKAVKDQADRHMHLMVYGDLIQSPQVKLAEKLAKLLPAPLHSTYLVTSGSEAIEGALKLARRYTGRTEVISFRNAYHGGTLGALSIAGNEILKNSFRPLVPGTRLLDFNDFDSLSMISGNTACVVVETVQAEAGIILPEPGFLELLREQCTKNGALLIIDDIQMGMGRTGRLFSFEHYGIVPDILCLAKAFGGGMPLGAFISSKEIMKTLASDPEPGHITTFGGHPVSCAAAIASLHFLTTSGLIDLAESKAHLFIKRLSGHPKIKEIRHKGLMIGVELDTSGSVQKLISIFAGNGLVTDSFLFRPNAFRIAPPLIITEAEIQPACDRIISSLEML